jgi:hypothetical protein
MYIIIIIIIIFIRTTNGFIPGGSGTIRHNTKIHALHKISHHAQIKHSPQSYRNNEGHITQNEYNTKKVKLSLQQDIQK